MRMASMRESRVSTQYNDAPRVWHFSAFHCSWIGVESGSQATITSYAARTMRAVANLYDTKRGWP